MLDVCKCGVVVADVELAGGEEAEERGQAKEDEHEGDVGAERADQEDNGETQPAKVPSVKHPRYVETVDLHADVVHGITSIKPN